MSNLKDFKNKNTEFTGTTGIDLPEGTTAQRVNASGNLRYNTETGLAEYYGENWKPIDSPPVLTSISPTSWDSTGAAVTITLTGSNFSSSVTIKFIGNDGTEYTAGSVNRVSASSVTCQTTAAMGVANEPYDVKLINSSGLASTLEDVLDAGAVPAFITGASLALIPVTGSAMTPVVIQAQDPDSTPITNMTVTSGSLPSGTSGAFTFANGVGNFTITGTPDAAASNSFTITATDGVNTTARAFTVTTSVPDGSAEGLAVASPAAATAAGVSTDGNRWFKPPGQTQAHQLYFEGSTGYVRLGNLSPGYSYFYIGNTSGNGTDIGTSCGSGSCTCTNIGSYSVGTVTTAFFDTCDVSPYCNYNFAYRDIANNTTINNAWLNALAGTLATGYKSSSFYLYHNDMEGTDNVGFNFSDGTQPIFTMSDNHTSPVCNISASDYAGTINSLVGSGGSTKVLTGMHYRGGSDPGAYLFTLRNSGIFIK